MSSFNFKNKKISLIADLQGVKLRVGKIQNDSQKIKFNQSHLYNFAFDKEYNLELFNLIEKYQSSFDELKLEENKYIFTKELFYEI